MLLEKVVKRLESKGHLVLKTDRINVIVVSIVPNHKELYFGYNFILLNFYDEKIYIWVLNAQYANEESKIRRVPFTGAALLGKFVELVGDTYNNIFVDGKLNSIKYYNIDNDILTVLKIITSNESEQHMQKMDNSSVSTDFSELREEIAKLREEITILHEQNKVLQITNNEHENIIQELRNKFDSLKSNAKE